MSLFAQKHHNCPTCRCTAALEPAPDLAELVEALRLLVESCSGEVAEVFRGEIGPSLRSASTALAKIKEPQHG